MFGSFMTVIQRFQQGESSMPAMPKPSALGALFDNESWSVHRKPYGLRFDHRGGTLSSPLVWTAMVYCNEFFDTLSRIISLSGRAGAPGLRPGAASRTCRRGG
ncbi:MAG: hypothetical protein R3F30_00930 [Planctomycetota bacterium]